MSIVRNSISAVSLALLTVGCDADSTPPSAPRDTPQSIRAAPASATHDRFRLREVGAQTLFASVDPSGCIETDVVIVGVEQTLKEGGKPTEQPLALVQVFVFDFCSGAVLRNLFGQTNDAEVVGDRQAEGVHLGDLLAERLLQLVRVVRVGGDLVEEHREPHPEILERHGPLPVPLRPGPCHNGAVGR